VHTTPTSQETPAPRRAYGRSLLAGIAIGATAAIAAGALVVGGSLAAQPQTATPAVEVTPPGPAGFGVFYVNGEQHVSNWSDNRDTTTGFPTRGRTTTYYQARVTYLRPDNPTKPNIVLVPGYGLAADIWMTTPDLREGWAQMLYNEGYPVYVVSPPDRGESMPIDQINKCKFGANPPKRCVGEDMDAYYGQLGRATLENSWPTWRFGPKYGVPYPDSQFPSLPLKQNYVEQFGASFVPYLGTSDIAMVQNTIMNDLTTDSLEALLAEIGPSVIVLHSAAGTGGFAAAINDTDMVKAVVAIETTKCPVDKPNGLSPLADTPFLGIWGDHITKTSPGGHWDRRESCEKMAASINKTGRAPAEVVSLPDRGLRGNSHMMMQDRNNSQVLGIITDWLTSNGI
jgi:pimeloyl-ACP methyl ester carboxylesterase